jgi:hypothetical protein
LGRALIFTSIIAGNYNAALRYGQDGGLLLPKCLQIGGPRGMNMAGLAGVGVAEVGVVAVEGEAGGGIGAAINLITKNGVVNGR